MVHIESLFLRVLSPEGQGTWRAQGVGVALMRPRGRDESRPYAYLGGHSLVCVACAKGEVDLGVGKSPYPADLRPYGSLTLRVFELPLYKRGI
jgi:hypothetical protein